MKFNLGFLSIRYLTSRPRQSLLTLMGIVLGTAAYVAISGMMLGFQVFIIDQLVNNDAHIRITARDEPVVVQEVRAALFPDVEFPNLLVKWISPPSGRRGELSIQNAQGLMERIQEDSRVEAFSPQLTARVMIVHGKQNLSARLIGAEHEKQIRVSTIEKYMVEGKFKDIGQTGNRVVVGQSLLENLGAQVGQTLWISNGKTEPVPVKVVGKFYLGVRGIDDTTIFGALTDVQKINQTPSVISDIAVRLKDVSLAREVADGWSLLSQDKVQSWDQANEGILSVFKTQDIVRVSMTVSILIVAGFGILNILSMTVNQKRKEIAILRSIGFEPKEIVNLFFSQGLLLGVVGGLIGIVLGYFVCRYMSTLQVGSGRAMGTTGKMLVSFDLMIYVRGFVLALASCTIAAVIPARSAGKLRPMEIIRSE